MNGGDKQQRGRIYYILLVIRVIFRRLPMSFYLVLALIVALILGAAGFRDLESPKQIAFTMTLFMVFFGAIVYRALIDALEIARNHRKEHDGLMGGVFSRDDFASKLGKRVSEQESDSKGSES